MILDVYKRQVPYGVNDEGYIDYDKVEELAMECKPKMIIAGASAYARTIDFKRFREIADTCGAVLMVDMAHIAGLVAAGLHPDVYKRQNVRISVMNLSAAMFMRKKNAVIVLQNFIAVADVQQTPIISMETSIMHTTSDVHFRKSVSNAQS